MSLNRVIKRLKIEMSGSTKQYQVSAKQSDRATRYVEIQLLDQGAEYEIPPGSNVTAYIKKPDLKRAYSPCTFSGSVVTMELTSQTLAAAGTALAEIEVKSGDMTEVITSCTFEIEIEPCVKDEDAMRQGRRRHHIRRRNVTVRRDHEGIRGSGSRPRDHRERQKDRRERPRDRRERPRRSRERPRQRRTPASAQRQAAQMQRTPA